MKIYRIIVIVLSAIIGISATILVNLYSPIAMPAYTGSITVESYRILKDYALEIANNFDTELKEDIVVTKTVTAETLIVNVDASVYGIEAVFPVSNYHEKIENGIIKCEGVIDYNNVTYTEHTDVGSPLFYAMLSILLAGICSVPPYFLFYVLPSSIIKRLAQKA